MHDNAQSWPYYPPFDFGPVKSMPYHPWEYRQYIASSHKNFLLKTSANYLVISLPLARYISFSPPNAWSCTSRIIRFDPGLKASWLGQLAQILQYLLFSGVKWQKWKRNKSRNITEKMNNFMRTKAKNLRYWSTFERCHDVQTCPEHMGSNLLHLCCQLSLSFLTKQIEIFFSPMLNHVRRAWNSRRGNADERGCCLHWHFLNVHVIWLVLSLLLIFSW